MLSSKPITALLILACLLAGFSSYTQNITLSYKNTPLKIVFSAIEKQTGYVFFKDRLLMQKAKNVTILVKDASLEQVLELCFRDQSFGYFIAGRTITIRPMESPGSDPPLAPAVAIITGTVMNENDEPVPGATIIAKEGRVQAVAGDDGRFVLRGIGDNDSILVTSINYESRKIRPGGRRMLDIQLKQRVAELGTAVSTGYQKTYKDKITGSVVSIDNSLFNRSVSVNVLDRLDGVTNGLLFNKNIVAGVNQSSMSIRGRSTLLANPEPLIVLDNFPYTGDVNNINPNDIESVTVLKDAAAAAIWGAFSGNGVIVYTTKKGKYNQHPRFSFNSNVTVAAEPNLWYAPRLSSSDYIDVEQFLFNHSFYDPLVSNPTHPALSPVVDMLYKVKSGMLTEPAADAQINVLRQQDTRDDQHDYFYRNSVDQQYALSMSGGWSKDQYYVSAGYDKDLSSLIGNGYNRITLTGNNSFVALNKKLEITTGIVFSSSRTRTNNAAGLSVSYPYLKLADASGNALTVPVDLRQGYKDTVGHGTLLDWNYRPLDELRLADNVTLLTDYKINIGLKYVLLKGLDANVYYQYNKGNSEQKNVMSQQTYYTRNLINEYTQVNGGVTSRPIPLGGILDKAINDYEANNIRGQLSYSRSWNANHVLTAIAGTELRSINASLSTTRLYGYGQNTPGGVTVDYQTSFSMYNAPFSLATIPNLNTSYGTTDHYISSYVNASYTWRQRYILSASARKDESNIFGVKSNQKGVPLWSAGASWNISRENFYGAGNWLPYLRLRITDGYNGNVDRSVSAYTTMLVNSPNVYGALTGTIINPPNPSLRWEKDNIVNIGLDFTLRNNVVSGSLEYYTRRGRDLIGYSPLDPTTGNATIRGNTANMSGRGVDIVLNTKNIHGKFNWNTSFLFSNTANRVTQYNATQSVVSSYFSPQINPLPGKPLYSVYALKWAGLDQNGNPQGFLNGVVSQNYSAIINSNNLNDLIYKG
ncbi:MAG TPA: SusC/RagA family TonB-linked outer membrane protein, partial [Chitinophagaceae bacterium]